MYTKDRRIESRLVCLTEPTQKLSIKKFGVTVFQRILNASHMDLMTEINIRKTIRQKVYFFF